MTPRTIKTLSPEQQAKLYDFLLIETNASTNKCHWTRDNCMILLMLDAGLRVAEVCGLRRIDLWFREGPVVDLTVPAAIAKNGISRTVPLSDRLREAIRHVHNWCWTGLKQPDTCNAFLTNSYESHITTRQVQRIVKDITIACLGVPFTPHALRHTFATKMMHLTDMRTVQALLGHSSLTSTQIYTHPTLADLRSAINKTNGAPLCGSLSKTQTP